MLNKYMIGRLGNQMFQYATIRAFQINNNLENEKLNFDFSKILERKDEQGFEDSLKYFNVAPYLTKKIKLNPILYIITNLGKVKHVLYFKKDGKTATRNIYKDDIKYQNFYNKLGLYNIRMGYTELKNYKNKNKYFYGTFECPKYFDSIKDTLIKEFTPKKVPLKSNRELYKAIKESESVCITIRRGDYVTDKAVAQSLYICTPKYFEVALKEMKRLVPNARLFVFSDDIKWCKENMKFPDDTMFESGSDPVWEKLRLMYSCKHFILSNSTFSWWAEYLSKNKNKKVITPSR